MFEHGCIHSIGRLWCENFVSNLEIRDKLLDPRTQSSEQPLNVNSLRWLGHVPRIPAEPLARCMLFFEVGGG